MSFCLTFPCMMSLTVRETLALSTTAGLSMMAGLFVCLFLVFTVTVCKQFWDMATMVVWVFLRFSLTNGLGCGFYIGRDSFF